MEGSDKNLEEVLCLQIVTRHVKGLHRGTYCKPHAESLHVPIVRGVHG